tara:strand:+ start:274 stop:645 length:372 start_codon:yes stop_codon:yes gene_type:complete
MTEIKLYSCGGFTGCYHRRCPTPTKHCNIEESEPILELKIKDNKLVRAYVACSWCNADCGEPTYHDIMGVLAWWDYTYDYEDFRELLINKYGEPRGKPISYERDSDGYVIQSTIKYEGEENEK